MPTYDLSTKAKGGTYVTSSHWLIAVIPIDNQFSFSRETFQARSDLGPQDLVKIRDPGVFLITSDCLDMSISGDKDKPTKMLQASLKNGSFNYFLNILNGDWILAWIVNSEEDLRALITKIKKKENCNEFDDGFKFLGRATNIRKQISQLPDGTRNTTVSLNAVGFSELQTELFYDANLSSLTNNPEIQNIGMWLATLNANVTSFFGEKLNAYGDNVSSIIPSLIDIFLTRGVNPTFANIAATQTLAFPLIQTAGLNANSFSPYAYTVPSLIGNFLGYSTSSGDASTSYGDIIDLLHGIQKYNEDGTTSPANIFTPKLDDSSAKNRKFTGIELKGNNTKSIPDFVNKPLWSVLTEYLNRPLNEMFTCMRVNKEGKVVPTIVLRQVPFTTPSFAKFLKSLKDAQSQTNADAGTSVFNSTSSDKILDYIKNEGGNIEFTAFHELPRWKIPPELLINLDMGRSDGLKFNFIHVYGQESELLNSNPVTAQIAINPPVSDQFDIARSGVRLFQKTLNVNFRDTAGHTPTVWIRFIADFLMYSQFTLTGTALLQGISEPICEGDNVEIDGLLFHIESVTHHVGMVGDEKQFRTELRLTNGMLANPSEPDDTQESKANYFYAGIKGSKQESAGSNSDTIILTFDKFEE